MADNSIKLFGWELKKSEKPKEETQNLKSVVPPSDDDGAGYVSSGPAAYYGHYIDISGSKETKDNSDLIKSYRGLATHPEVDQAIEEIVNETIITGDNESPVELNLDKVELTQSIKNKINTEFENICSMLNFNDLGHDIFKSWYVDGRLYHHLLVDEKNKKAGIQEIRYIDATKIRKVKNVKYEEDPKTGVKIVKSTEEFYIYENAPKSSKGKPIVTNTQGVKLSTDSISYVTSGLLDENRTKVVSYLHKAMRPINQLRMMEDSLVIYRLARAPERRIFYIDVGNLPRGRAEEYMKNIMARYRNKLVYDANTGQVKDDRKHMSMLEDFWLPRKEGGRGTEISTLPGGQNLGEIEDILYFQKNVFKALGVPADRLRQESTYSLGRSTEIQRDEVKFQKFVNRLRSRFSKLFIDILKKQLILKGIITADDWTDIKENIFVDYQKDNYYTELKELEMMRERLNLVDQSAQYVGQFLSKEYVMKKILSFSDEEMDKILLQIESEKEQGEVHEFSPAEQETPAVQQQISQETEEEPAPKESFSLEQEESLVRMEMMETVKDFLSRK